MIIKDCTEREPRMMSVSRDFDFGSLREVDEESVRKLEPGDEAKYCTAPPEYREYSIIDDDFQLYVHRDKVESVFCEDGELKVLFENKFRVPASWILSISKNR